MKNIFDRRRYRLPRKGQPGAGGRGYDENGVPLAEIGEEGQPDRDQQRDVGVQQSSFHDFLLR